MVTWVETGRAVFALGWDGDDLVDWARGPDRWALDGAADVPRPRIRREFGFAFDQGVVSPSGRFRVVYAERGTKALLLRDGDLVRELNRSYAHADAYDYPIALGRLSVGREIVVHCPEQYDVLEIDDAETGERLTTRPQEGSDFFHSRLSVSPDGRYLADVGWVWHPYGMAQVFDLDRVLAAPGELDGRGQPAFRDAVSAEVFDACWLDGDRLAVATTGGLGVWSAGQGRWLSRAALAAPAGALVAVAGRLISLYGHPRLLDPSTGRVLAEWPEVAVPEKEVCFGVQHVPTPIAVPHPGGGRLAVGCGDRVAVLDFPA